MVSQTGIEPAPVHTDPTPNGTPKTPTARFPRAQYVSLPGLVRI